MPPYLERLYENICYTYWAFKWCWSASSFLMPCQKQIYNLFVLQIGEGINRFNNKNLKALHRKCVKYSLMSPSYTRDFFYQCDMLQNTIKMLSHLGMLGRALLWVAVTDPCRRNYDNQIVPSFTLSSHFLSFDTVVSCIYWFPIMKRIKHNWDNL